MRLFILNPQMHSGLALIKIQGGLGNQLFQFALGKYMQKHFGYRPLFFYPGLEEKPGPETRSCQIEYICKVKVLRHWQARALNLLSLNKTLSAIVNKSKFAGIYSDIEHNCIVLPEHRQFDKPRLFRKISIFRGSWHNLAATNDILDDTKTVISSNLQYALMRKSLSENIDYKMLLQRSVIVHVRLGDLPNQLGSSYYKRAFEDLYEKHPRLTIDNVFFLSDEPARAVKILSFLGDSLVELPFGDPVLVLSALASAKYKILSNSTLSLWGALLSIGGATSVYPAMPNDPPAWRHEIGKLYGMRLIMT